MWREKHPIAQVRPARRHVRWGEKGDGPQVKQEYLRTLVEILAFLPSVTRTRHGYSLLSSPSSCSTVASSYVTRKRSLKMETLNVYKSSYIVYE
jgi:hypothetical protein